MNTFAQVFLVLALAALGWRMLLLVRQARHVRANRERVPDAFAAVVPLEAHRKAADYTLDKVRVALVESVALDGVLLLVLTLGGGLAVIDAVATTSLGTGHARDLATVFAVGIVGALAALPFDLWRTFGIEARHGFNKTTPLVFVMDLAKGAALAVVLGAPLLLLVFWLLDIAGTYWWLYAWAAWVAFTLILTAIFPRWIAPLFNKFTPLEDGELRSRIESLVRRCGFRAESLFVMDGSRRSSHGNAYFTGFGADKRIVFFDTLIERLTPSEIEAVLAHELGHFARGHIPRMLAVRFALALVLLGRGWAGRRSTLVRPRPSASPRSAPRGAAGGLLPRRSRVHLPVPASREPHRAQARVRGRRLRRAACARARPRERPREALPRQRRHAHARSAALAGV